MSRSLRDGLKSGRDFPLRLEEIDSLDQLAQPVQLPSSAQSRSGSPSLSCTPASRPVTARSSRLAEQKIHQRSQRTTSSSRRRPEGSVGSERSPGVA
jgi:hypothetical protein